MNSFKDFYYNENRAPFSGNTQAKGFFGLPDLRNIDEPSDRPNKGWSSLDQIGNASLQQMQYDDREKYILAETLEKFKALAENVISAIQLRDSQTSMGQNLPNPTKFKSYEKAQYIPQKNIIIGLSKAEVVGGEYPRLRNEEMARADKLKIIIPDPTTPDAWVLDINQLRNQMELLHKELKNFSTIKNITKMGMQAANKALDHSLTPTINMGNYTKMA